MEVLLAIFAVLFCLSKVKLYICAIIIDNI